jgi:hypothetical protein
MGGGVDCETGIARRARLEVLCLDYFYRGSRLNNSFHKAIDSCFQWVGDNFGVLLD